MADQERPADNGCESLAEGLRLAGVPEDEITALLDGSRPDVWRTWGVGMAEAKGTLDRMLAGIPGPTHRGKGRA